MITVSDVSLSFGGQMLFKDVNLLFTAGNCYGVIGANGAGKSTFLKILCGALEPTTGTVTVQEGLRMSVLKQDHYAYDEYTVQDTVIMGNPRLYEVMKQKDALYAKEDFTEEDGNLASELEGEFAELGGWEAESTVEYFKRYVSYVMEQLGSELHIVCTINEANMGLQLAAISKRFRLMAEQAAKAAANAGKSAEGSVQVGMNFQKMMENMKYAAAENAAVFGTPQPKIFVSERTPEGDLLVLRAHAAAREAIKTICPEVKVGLTLSLHDLQAQPGGEAFAAAAWEEEFTHYLPYIKEDDLLGVLHYTRTLYGAHGQLPAPQGAELPQMDYEFYPQALENVIRKVAQDFHGDLIVTENGIATADDTRRVAFIEAALAGVQNCIADGIPVKGYFHWSLMDNFEWQKGYAMNFGLIAVNRETMGRTPKPSLAALGGYANA